MADCFRPNLFVVAWDGRLFDTQSAYRGMGWPVVLDPICFSWRGMVGCFRTSLLVVARDGRLFETLSVCCGIEWSVV